MTDLPDSQKLYPENTNPEETKQENEPADLDHRKGKGSRHPTLNTQFTGNSQRDGLKVDKRTDDVYNVHASSGQNISKLPKKPLVDSEEILKIQDIKQKTCENKGSKKVNIGTNDENAITGTEKDLANNRNMAKDTPACDTRLHNENREFREDRQTFEEQSFIPLHQFTDELRRVDGQNDLPMVQVRDAIQNGDLDIVTERDSHDTLIVQPSESEDSQNAGYSIATSSRTPVNHILNYEYLSNLTIINYCTLSSFFEGLHKTLCLHPATKKRLMKYLRRSRFRVYRMLVEVIKGLDANQTYEAIKFWIFENFTLKDIQRNWVKVDGFRYVINLFDTEENTTLQKIGETFKSFFLGCTCTSDRILLHPVSLKLKVMPKDILQTSVSDFMVSHEWFCQFDIGGSNSQYRDNRRRFKEQPLILPVEFKVFRRYVGQKDLPKTLQVGDARYNLAFYTELKNKHFTAVIYNHSYNRWEEASTPEPGASSGEKPYISTVYFILNIQED